jgi:hypothetical protein
MQTEAAAKQPSWACDSKHDMHPSNLQQEYVGFPFMSLSGAGKAQNSQDADEVEALESSIDEVRALEPSIFRGKEDQKQGTMSWLFDCRLAQGCRGHMSPQTLGMEGIPLQTPNKLLQPRANERDVEDRGQRERCAVDILKAGVREKDALWTPRSKAGALAKAATDRALNANRSCVCL